MDPNLASVVAELAQSLGLPRGQIERAVSNYTSLPESQKAQIAAKLLRDPVSLIEFSSSVNTDSKPDKPVFETRSANQILETRSANQIFDVTANYVVNASIFGVDFGSFRQTYKYQTNATLVTASNNCDSYFVGFSSIWNISTNSAYHRIENNKGVCTQRFTLSAIFKGNSVNVQKEIGQRVNGKGVESQWLYNL